jgi:hypothetical protein
VAIRWGVLDPNGSAPVAPGASLSGFSIKVPKADDKYLNANVRIYLTAGPAMSVTTVKSGAIDQPPELSVELNPNSIWPPNKKMVPIEAKITVKDDKDTSPTVKLVSVTCNDGCNIAKDIANAKTGIDTRKFSVRASRLGKQKNGREYTVTYSATDSAGNVATAAAVVKVPHDQRK